MTIGVGYLTGRGCWLGADTYGVRGGYLKLKVKKLIIRPKRLSYVVAGTCIGLELVREALEELEDADNSSRCVRVPDFPKALVRVCKERGWNGSDANGFEVPERNIQALVTDGRILIEFTTDQWYRYPEPGEFLAIGSGSEVAIGAAHATRNFTRDPDLILKAALEAACKFSSGCDYPYESVEVLPGPFELVP